VGRVVVPFDPMDPASVRRAERRYERELLKFERKVDQFLAEIAELGRSTAESGYGGMITVTVEPISNGYAINAAGEDIIFLEFGAGDSVNSGNIFAGQTGVDVRPGSYSEQNPRQPRPSYHIDGFWIFGNTIYTQVRPRNAMQGAWDTVLQQWRDVAERVFS